VGKVKGVVWQIPKNCSSFETFRTITYHKGHGKVIYRVIINDCSIAVGVGNNENLHILDVPPASQR
jgi:hypothetical protein